MHRQMMGLAFCIAAFTVRAAAQSNTFPTSGNVGIGTTNPGATLDVYGNGGSANINVGTNGTLSSGGEVFKINSNIYPLDLVSASGNVGIGTTSPQGQLNIGNVSNAGLKTYTNGQGDGLVVNTYYNASNIYESYVDLVAARTSSFINGGSNFRFITQPLSSGNPAVAMVINQSGNVGIGTTNPADKLDVVGTVRSSISGGNFSFMAVGNDSSTNITSGTNTGLYLQNTSATAGNHALIQGWDANGNQQGSFGFLYGSHTGNFQASLFIEPRNVATPSAFVVASTGNVGIGTTGPGATLDVYGNGGSANINVGTNGTLSSGGGVFKINSNIYPLDLVSASGNVGIGTTSPQFSLDVAGQIHSSRGIVFPDGSVQTTATGQTMSATNAITQSGGNVGIGTTNPTHALDIVGTYSSGSPVNVAKIGTNGFGSAAGDTVALLFGGIPGGDFGRINVYAPGSGDLAMNLGVWNGSSVADVMTLKKSGNVGIGTTAPGAMLEVNGSSIIDGNLTVGSGSNGSHITFQDGTTQSTAWTGTACGGDYAESVDVSGDRTHYGPGDVLVIDPSAPGKFLKSMEPYSTLVSGIYSTKPGLVGRRQAGDAKSSTTEIPMAMVGIVPTKVSAENGPIRTGDLLVASATMGHAMKGTDRSQLTGAVIGKALGNLDSGTGVIEVLVTLQ